MMAKIRQFNREYWWLTMGIGIPVLAPIAVTVLYFGPISLAALLIALLLVGLWHIVAILSLAICIHAITKKNYRKAALALITPLICMSIYIPSLQVLDALGASLKVGKRVYFFTRKPFYDAQVAQTPKPRFLVFDEEGLTTAYHGFVYDDSDEVMLPRARQTKDFRSRINDTDLSCDEVGFEPLGGHYYYVVAFC